MKSIFELFITQKIEFKFVLFSIGQTLSQMFWDPIKNRASSRLLAKNRVPHMFWEPIKNRVSPRSAIL